MDRGRIERRLRQAAAVSVPVRLGLARALAALDVVAAAARVWQERARMFADEPVNVAEVNVGAGSEWITAGEAAALLGVTPQHVTRLARAGQVDARQVRRRGPWLVDRASLALRQVA